MIHHRIAVAARKGGLGKTTVACGLASVLSHQGMRVLVIDLDPQSNAAYVLGVDPIAPGTAELLTVGVPSPQTATANLHVLPGGPELGSQRIQSLHPEELAEAVQSLNYDAIVFDCPPGNEYLERLGLVAAEIALVVTNAHPLAVMGASRVLEILENYQKKGWRGAHTVLGLLEPLVVDNRGRLLAGGHRKAAIWLVKENSPEAYAQHFPGDMVPVRMMPFDADADPERALQVEISENEKRRDYTPAEVRALAERLRAAGYVDTPGRPTKDEKILRPALEVIVGKSLRSVRRYLTEEKPVQLGQVYKKTALRQAKTALERWQSIPETEKNTSVERQLAKKLPQLLELIEKTIAEGYNSPLLRQGFLL